jgi:hypothetical protein
LEEDGGIILTLVALLHKTKKLMAQMVFAPKQMMTELDRRWQSSFNDCTVNFPEVE